MTQTLAAYAAEQENTRMNKAGKIAGAWESVVLVTLGTLWVLQGALALTPEHGVIVMMLVGGVWLFKQRGRLS